MVILQCCHLAFCQRAMTSNPGNVFRTKVLRPRGDNERFWILSSSAFCPNPKWKILFVKTDWTTSNTGSLIFRLLLTFEWHFFFFSRSIKHFNFWGCQFVNTSSLPGASGSSCTRTHGLRMKRQRFYHLATAPGQSVNTWFWTSYVAWTRER